MSSDDEKYLDSLLNSARSNNKNPKSAISRMSKGSRSDSGKQNTAPGDIGALVYNESDNEDLREIGEALDRLDRNELVDEGMADLLDSIETVTDPRIPQFSIGGNPSIYDTRDPEEIALDEAIADAERMDAEIQSGKFDEAPDVSPEKAPLVEEYEGDDALLEMAPEVILPEESIEVNNSTGGEDGLSGNNLNAMLDDMSDSSAQVLQDEVNNDSLSDALDGIQDLDAVTEELADTKPQSDSDIMTKEEIEALMDSGLGYALENEVQEEAATEPSLAESLEESIPEELTEAADGLTEAIDESGSESDNSANLDNLMSHDIDPNSLEGMLEHPENVEDLESLMSESGLDGDISGFTLDGDSGFGDAIPIEDNPEAEGMESLGDLEGAITEEIPDLEDSADESGSKNATDAMALDPEGDDFNLEDLEASLDDLLGDEADLSEAEGIEGEIADTAAMEDFAETNTEHESEGEAPSEPAEGADGGEVSLEDLDSLMNSLANDEIEDLENVSAGESDSEEPAEEEGSVDNIMDALTEDGFGEGAEEPSLDDLASIPERKRSGRSDDDEEEDDDDEDSKGKKKKGKQKDKNKKKKGLGAFFSGLFKTLTEEESEANEGLASLTDENATVLKELGDGEVKPKKEKKKKEKKEKPKKPPKEKKPKEKKPPKPKKEKKPKPPKDPGEPEKVMSPKKVALSGLFAASIGILVMIPVLVLPERIASERAESAYAHEEYTTAYKMLYGKEMTEDQTVIYEQSRVLAWAERYLSGYENYVAMNMQEEALDMLLMAMRNKDNLIEEAVKFGVEIQVQTVYDSIESLLSSNYGLSETDISEINSIKKERDYTIRLMEIVGTLES